MDITFSTNAGKFNYRVCAVILHEGNHTHRFEWLQFERLQSEYFYPLFLKEKIFALPAHLQLLSTFE